MPSRGAPRGHDCATSSRCDSNARHSSCGQPSSVWQRASRGRFHALALTCLLSVALAAGATLAWPGGNVAASGTGGALSFTPAGGPIGTQVSVTIFTEPPGPTPYLLSASPTDPSQDNCADGVVLSDTPKIIVQPGQPATATFAWPSDHPSGAFYLCASPVSSERGPTVWSSQPFAVTGDLLSGQTSTSTPADSGVTVLVPSGGVAAGSSFTLTVDTSVALRGYAPNEITLIGLTDLNAVRVHWEQTALEGTVYTYVVTVPEDAPPGLYEAQVLAAGLPALSQPFHVVAHSKPPPISVLGISATSPGDALLIAAIALLIAIAIASLVAPLLRRRFARHPPAAPSR